MVYVRSVDGLYDVRLWFMWGELMVHMRWVYVLCEVSWWFIWRELMVYMRWVVGRCEVSLWFIWGELIVYMLSWWFTWGELIVYMTWVGGLCELTYRECYVVTFHCYIYREHLHHRVELRLMRKYGWVEVKWQVNGCFHTLRRWHNRWTLVRLDEVMR